MLEITDNQSKFIQEAIVEKLERMQDPKIIDVKITELQKQIRDLKQSQAQAREGPTDQDILNKWHKKCVEQRIMEGESFMFYKWVKTRVIPELKKAGYRKYNPDQVIAEFNKLNYKHQEIKKV